MAELSPNTPTNPAVTLRLRDATEADLPAIQAIYAHHVLQGVASFEETPPSVDELRGRLASVRSHGLPYRVAEIDGTVAGYCYATPYRPRAACRNTIEDSIYIDDAFRGRGIGRILLEAGGFKHGRWVDTTLMQRALGVGDGALPEDRTG
jgi:L-amino acid N-acyltransferase YncA